MITPEDARSGQTPDSTQGLRTKSRSTGTHGVFSIDQMSGTQRRIRGEEVDTYDRYAESDASRFINSYSANKIQGRKSRLLDVASGTGATFPAAFEAGRLTPGFVGIGVDMDRSGLSVARQKLAGFQGVDSSGRIQMVQGSADELPVESGWADLVTCLNAIHLFNNPSDFLQEAYRSLQPGGGLVVNSAYVKDSMYANKKSQDAIRSMFVGAARYVQRRGLVRGATFDPARFTKEQYSEMATEAGFTNVEVELVTVNMNPKDLAAIFSTHEFDDGALPNIPYEIARRGLVGSIRAPMRRFGIDTVDRNWMVLTAQKPV